MKKTRMRIVVSGLVIAIVAGLALSNIYILRDDCGGELLWNSNQAYLFMKVARRGYRIKILAYPFTVLREWLGDPPLPSDQLIFLTATHVTASGMEQSLTTVVPNTSAVPDLFTPKGGTIYANCAGILCKLKDGQFQQATHEEEERLNGINGLSPDVDTKVDDWEKRGIGSVVKDSQFTIELKGGVTLLIQQGSVQKSVSDAPTVSIQRSGQPTQTLWHLSGDPRWVSRAEYARQIKTP